MSGDNPTVETDCTVVTLSRKDIQSLVRDQHVAVFQHTDPTEIGQEGDNPFVYLYLNGGEHSGTDYRALFRDWNDPPRPEARCNVGINALAALMRGETIRWSDGLYIRGTEITHPSMEGDE